MNYIRYVLTLNLSSNESFVHILHPETKGKLKERFKMYIE